MISQATIENALASQFHDRVRLKPRRANILQVYAPFYHEDGDMLDMFIEPRDGGVRVCDFGKTLMRLSYDFEIDSENKLRIFHDLLTQNQVEFDEATGNIYLDTTENNICNSVLHLSQVIAKVSKLDVLKREIVSGLFFEMVDEFITSDLLDFNPRLKAHPLPGRDEVEVNCEFAIRPHPVYLFAVRNSSQAKLATIAFLEFQRAALPFKGYVVHDDMESLPKNDRKRLTSAADKQFISLDDFRENAASVLRREMVA
jgi:hypothetical protein